MFSMTSRSMLIGSSSFSASLTLPRRRRVMYIQREAALVGAQGMLEVALQVIREAEVIEDVRLQRARGNVARIWLPIRLDFVRLPAYENCGDLEIAHRIPKSTNGDVAVPAMAIEP